jgi:hypothetical protein
MNGYPRNLILEGFMKICRENPNMVQIGQNHRILWIAERYKCYANAPQCYVIHALSILFKTCIKCHHSCLAHKFSWFHPGSMMRVQNKNVWFSTSHHFNCPSNQPYLVTCRIHSLGEHTYGVYINSMH